jgi:hypothetical protein
VVDFLTGLDANEYKACKIIDLFYQQRNLRDAYYYTNELARKFLLQGKLQFVLDLFERFKIDSSQEAGEGEIAAYLEER